ncbi:hypothetical protein EAG_10331 [Camponotus floridanus]|uniref:Uncharacterized protein n=1 Tax=Camponotus floridanus TaxID=104421 RepID=E2AM23_CAMFO|nr:hypothetical protein EAG_10331 [Camponotus floridanus]
MTQAQTPHLYTPPIGGTIAGGTLTPLAPLTMQELKLSQTLDGANMSPYHTTAESSTVAVSYVGVGAGGGEQSPPISLQNETNATPAAPNTPGGDPGLTVLQPPVSQPQVASAIPPYSTMLPSFGHYATGGGDYAYSAAYSQYSSAPYSGYGYGAATSGLLKYVEQEHRLLTQTERSTDSSHDEREIAHLSFQIPRTTTATETRPPTRRSDESQQRGQRGLADRKRVHQAGPHLRHADGPLSRLMVEPREYRGEWPLAECPPGDRRGGSGLCDNGRHITKRHHVEIKQ